MDLKNYLQSRNLYMLEGLVEAEVLAFEGHPGNLVTVKIQQISQKWVLQVTRTVTGPEGPEKVCKEHIFDRVEDLFKFYWEIYLSYHSAVRSRIMTVRGNTIREKFGWPARLSGGSYVSVTSSAF